MNPGRATLGRGFSFQHLTQMKNALRGSHLWIHLCVVLFLSVGRLNAQLTIGHSKLGNSPDGSVWKVEVTYNINYYLPGNPGYGTGYSGFAIAVKEDGVFVGGNIMAEANNAETPDYHPLITGGAGSATITLTPGKTGTLVVATRPIGSNTYTTVEYDLGTSTVGSYIAGNKQITWRIPANNSPNPINWQVWRNSDNAPVANYMQAPGSGATDFTASGLPSDTSASDYSLKYWVSGAALDGTNGIWVTVNPATVANNATDLTKPDDDDETVFPAVTPTPAGSGNVLPQGTTPTADQKVNVATPSQLPSAPISPPGSGGNVWISAGGGGGVSDGVYKEGVDKIVKAIQDAEGEKVAKSVTAAQKAGGDAADGMGAAGAAKKVETEAAFVGVPVVPAEPSVSSSAPDLSITLPSALGGQTFNLDPFSAGRFATVATWFRQAVKWLLGVLFFTHVVTVCAPYIRGISQAQQAKGNPVIGGTGAQATALVAAGLMTAAIITCIAALLAVAFADVGFGTLASVVSANPYAGLPGTAAYILDQLFPLGAIVLFFVGRPLVDLAFMKIFAAASTVVRFIVP